MTIVIPPECVEKMDLISFGKGAQIVAMSAPDLDEGVTTLSHALAKRVHEMGLKTLHLTFSSLKNNDLDYYIGKETIGNSFAAHEDGYFTLYIHTKQEDVLKWAELDLIVKFLNMLKKNFQRIVLDLPPLLNRQAKEVSPVPIAAKADCMLLISKVGSLTAPQLQQIVYDAEQASVNIGGVILNDRDYPTVGIEIARQAEKLGRLFPKKSKKWAENMRNSEFLNVHM